MTRKGCIWGWLIGIVALLVIFLVTIIAIESLLGQSLSFPTLGARVGLVRVVGVLTDPTQIVEDLETMASDAGVRAIILRVDSPGGGAAASYEIYKKIVEVRDAGMPIVVSMGSVAASGGYYISCPADSILANPSTITGSIGVIMSFANIEELLGKIGLDYEVVKSGEFKDIGSWSRRMTEAERALLQGTIDDIYEQFIEIIALEREMSEEEIRALADGRILSGRQALDAGLVDAVGTLDDAIRMAGRMGEISGKPRVQEPVRRNPLTLRDLLARSVSRLLEPGASSHGAQYLYRPAK